MIIVIAGGQQGSVINFFLCLFLILILSVHTVPVVSRVTSSCMRKFIGGGVLIF
jgi:hypothetical protein